jgi:branched-chain amino acid transport system substrate-binding protein
MVRRNTTRTLASFVSLVGLTLTASACGGVAGGSDRDTVTIGQLAHVTGTSAGPYGIPFDRGLTLGVEKVNDSGVLGDVKLKLKTQDVAAEIPAAVTGFNQFMRDGVDIVVSPNSTPVELALTPLVNEEHAFLLTGATGEDVADNVFALPDAVTPQMGFAQELVKQGYERILVVIDGDNPAFDTIATNFEAGLEKAGRTLEDRLTISAGDSDFAPVITTIEREAPDAIFFATLSETAGNLMAQIRRSGALADTAFTGSMAWQQQVHDIAGDAAVGALFPALWAPGGAESEDFQAAYEEEYGEQPVPYSALGYQAAWLIAGAINLAMENGEDVNGAAVAKHAIEAATSSVATENGVISGFQFTSTGLPLYPGVFVTFDESGSIVPMEGAGG